MEPHPEESSEAPGRRTGSVAVLKSLPDYAPVLPLISCTLGRRARKLDVLIGDTAILDYFRANDPGCNLNLLGDSIFDDAYAVAMHKGFPLKVITHSPHALLLLCLRLFRPHFLTSFSLLCSTSGWRQRR